MLLIITHFMDEFNPQNWVIDELMKPQYQLVTLEQPFHTLCI